MNVNCQYMFDRLSLESVSKQFNLSPNSDYAKLEKCINGYAKNSRWHQFAEFFKKIFGQSDWAKTRKLLVKKANEDQFLEKVLGRSFTKLPEEEKQILNMRFCNFILLHLVSDQGGKPDSKRRIHPKFWDSTAKNLSLAEVALAGIYKDGGQEQRPDYQKTLMKNIKHVRKEINHAKAKFKDHNQPQIEPTMKFAYDGYDEGYNKNSSFTVLCKTLFSLNKMHGIYVDAALPEKVSDAE